MPGLQGQAGVAGEGGHLQQVEDLGDLPPPEQAVGAAGRLGVLPGCQAGHCGYAGEGRQSAGTLPYSGVGAGQQAAPSPGPAQGAGAQGSTGSGDPSPISAPSRSEGVQVKLGSLLAPYLIQEMVQADRLHLLMSQLKEPVHFYCTETPVSRCWFVAFQRSISVAFHCTETPVSTQCILG